MVEVVPVFHLDRILLRLMEQIIMFGGVFPPRQDSTAFRGPEHHDDDCFLPEQSSAAFRGDHHHDDVDSGDESVEVRHDDWVSMVDDGRQFGTVVTTRHTGACLPARFTGGCVFVGERT